MKCYPPPIKYHVAPFDFTGHKHGEESRPEQLTLYEDKLEVKWHMELEVQDEETKVIENRTFRGCKFFRKSAVIGASATFNDKLNVYDLEIITIAGSGYIFTCPSWEVANEIRKLIDNWINPTTHGDSTT